MARREHNGSGCRDAKPMCCAMECACEGMRRLAGEGRRSRLRSCFRALRDARWPVQTMGDMRGPSVRFESRCATNELSEVKEGSADAGRGPGTWPECAGALLGRPTMSHTPGPRSASRFTPPSSCAGEHLLRASEALRKEQRLMIRSNPCALACAPPRERERGTEHTCRILDSISPEEPSLDERLSSTLERTFVLDISVDPPPPPSSVGVHAYRARVELLPTLEDVRSRAGTKTRRHLPWRRCPCSSGRTRSRSPPRTAGGGVRGAPPAGTPRARA
jgi:hypothetical protein